MIKLDYKRLLFSKSTILILLLLIVIISISFFISLSEKNLFIELLADPNEDFNREAAAHFVASYDGWRFMYNLWYNPLGMDAFTIIILISWLGVTLTDALQKEKENGFGNLVMTRTSYMTRFLTTLASQSLYLVTIMFSYVALAVFLAMILGGIPTMPFQAGTGDVSSWIMMGLMFLQAIWLSIVMITINAFCHLANLWIKNRYLLRILPFLIYVVLPVLSGTIIGNTFPNTASILSNFQPESIFSVFYFLFQPYQTINHAFWRGSIVIMSVSAFLVLYPFYRMKGSKDYL